MSSDRPWWVVDQVGMNLVATCETREEAVDLLRRVREVNPDMPDGEMTVECDPGIGDMVYMDMATAAAWDGLRERLGGEGKAAGDG